LGILGRCPAQVLSPVRTGHVIVKRPGYNQTPLCVRGKTLCVRGKRATLLALASIAAASEEGAGEDRELAEKSPVHRLKLRARALTAVRVMTRRSACRTEQAWGVEVVTHRSHITHFPAKKKWKGALVWCSGTL